jgi:hypothetical protein
MIGQRPYNVLVAAADGSFQIDNKTALLLEVAK